MRRIPVPNSNSPYEFGVELDKTLTDGSQALGIVRVTDQQSPFNPNDMMILVDAWQINKEGRPVQIQGLTGPPRKVAIHQMVVIVPRDQYSHEAIEKQIAVAATALASEAKDIPGPVSLPTSQPDVAPAPNPAVQPAT